MSIEQHVKNNTAGRDIALDALGGLAVIFMVAAHFSREIPHPSKLGDLFRAISEIAPVFFFIRLGMTFNLYQRKDKRAKAIQRKNFLYVALMHNLYVMHSLVKADFLLFLWLWQNFLDIAEGFSSKIARIWPAAIMAILTFQLIFSPGTLGRVFAKIVPGNFPLLPWGAYVLIGVILSRRKHRLKENLIGSIILILISILLLLIYEKTGYLSLKLAKWPPSLTYIMLYGSIAAFIYGLVSYFDKAYLHIPKTNQLMSYFSHNLIISTVMHYFAVIISGTIFIEIFRLMEPRKIANMDFYIMVVGTIITVILLFYILKLGGFVWSRISTSRPLLLLRSFGDLGSILIIILTTIIVQNQFFTGPMLGRFFVYGSMQILINLVALSYFAFVLVDSKQNVLADFVNASTRENIE